jgi:hypothetical protein
MAIGFMTTDHWQARATPMQRSNNHSAVGDFPAASPRAESRKIRRSEILKFSNDPNKLLKTNAAQTHPGTGPSSPQSNPPGPKKSARNHHAARHTFQKPGISLPKEQTQQ